MSPEVWKNVEKQGSPLIMPSSCPGFGALGDLELVGFGYRLAV